MRGGIPREQGADTDRSRCATWKPGHATAVTSLGLFDFWSGLLDARFHQLGFHLRFLVDEQSHFGLKGAISRQFHLNPVFARADLHGMKSPAKLARVTHKFAIQKYGGATWFYGEL